MKLIPYIALSTLALAAGVPVLAQQNVQTEWPDSSTLRLRFTLTEAQGAVGSNYAVCATPYLYSDRGDTLQLAPVYFRGKRNQRYTERARYYGDAAPALGQEYALGGAAGYDLTLRRTDYPWLFDGKVSVGVRREKEGCCNVADLPGADRGYFVYIPPFNPLLPLVPDNSGRAGELQKENPVLRHISQYRPYDKSRILRKEKDALTIYFPLDKSQIRTDFRENKDVLDRIVRITREVMADSTSSVKIIQIIGLASVEGPQARNKRLAGQRADVLKRYIQQYVSVPDSLFECNNGGEAWTELRDQIEELQFEGRDEILRIIDTEPNLDRREARIKQLNGGRTYKYLKQHVLIDQRNSGYLQIYYDYVPDYAAATINKASALLGEEKYDEALRLLRTVEGDKRAYNALGVACYMTGNTARGLKYLKAAAADGNEAARDNLCQMQATERARQIAAGSTQP